MRDYELMYIVRPDLDDEGLNEAVASIKTLVETNGGQVIKSTMWGKRRLAYEVKHLRDGHYVLANIEIEPTKVHEIERALRIHDTVFRHLLVSGEHVEPGDEDELPEGASATVASNGEAGAIAAPVAPDPIRAQDDDDDDDDGDEDDGGIVAVAAGVDEEDN